MECDYIHQLSICLICSKTKLGSELDKINNCSLKKDIQQMLLSCINQKLANFAAEKNLVQRSARRLADRINQHVPTSIRKKSNTAREQPPRICKNNKSKINCESAIGQHLIANPECAKTYTDDSVRVIGQARSSFHLSVLESVFIKTQNPVLCR